MCEEAEVKQKDVVLTTKTSSIRPALQHLLLGQYDSSILCGECSQIVASLFTQRAASTVPGAAIPPLLCLGGG